MKRIALVGGGTGGHFYPLMSVAEHIRGQYDISEVEIVYLGPEPYDQSELDRNFIQFVKCPAGKQRRYFSLLNFTDMFKTLWGIFVAIWKLYVLYPDVVFSKGGYTSVPVVLAAFFLRIPIVIHESDSVPGRANKLAAPLARYIAISFKETIDFFPAKKTALIGVPIRLDILNEYENPMEKLGLPEDKPVIFVTGGSSGADRLNTLILQSLDELLPEYTILHQTGTKSELEVRQTASLLIKDDSLLKYYFVKGNLSSKEMSLALSSASLVVSRAGSGTIYEIASKRKPSILIPIPEEISHDQRSNAYAYARNGAAEVLEEGNIADGLLYSRINKIMNEPNRYEKMKQSTKEFLHTDPGSQIAKVLLGIAKEHL